MISCKEANIPLCPTCDSISVGGCWLQYWESKFILPPINSFIAQYQMLPSNVIDYNYKLYFIEAAKLFHPKLYEQLSKLIILE
jgi:hypothetical protein